MSYCPTYRVNQEGEEQTGEICLRCHYDKQAVEFAQCCLCGMVSHQSKDCPILKELQQNR